MGKKFRYSLLHGSFPPLACWPVCVHVCVYGGVGGGCSGCVAFSDIYIFISLLLYYCARNYITNI